MRLPATPLLLVLAAAPSWAQNSIPTVAACKLAAPPSVDGSIGEEEWKGATRFSGLRDRQDGSPAENGEFWLGFDDQALYFAARLADRNPGSIKATEYRTNAGLGGDDHVILLFEPNGTTTDWNAFSMNPIGGSNLQIAGGRAVKREWLGEFATRGRITETGWEVEARIPWKLMQLPPAGARNARINVARYSTATQRLSVWAYQQGSSLSGNDDFIGSYGLLSGIEIPKLASNRTLKLLPYGYLGRESDGAEIVNGGLDIKTSLSETLEGVLTINPDFRNVEGDILSLEFSYFERLPTDTRPFFQEGRNYWTSAVFTSQRIDRFDTGINLYGRLNERLSMAALATIGFDSETAATGAFSYQADSRNFYRAAVAAVQGDVRPDNAAAMFRFQRQTGGLDLNFRHQASDDEVDGNGHRSDVFLGFNRGAVSGFLGYDSISPDFRPRLGFLQERDLKGPIAELNYNRTESKGPIMEWGLNSFGVHYNRYHGGFYRWETGLGGSVTMRDGLDLDFWSSWADFQGSRDRYYFLSLEKPRRDTYRRWQLDYVWGKIAGEDYRSATLLLLYRPLAKLQSSLGIQRLEHFDTATQTILSANYDLGRDQSLSGRLVQRDDDVSGYFSFRRSGNRGAEYYLIVGDPNSQKFRSSVILKVAMPFELKL